MSVIYIMKQDPEERHLNHILRVAKEYIMEILIATMVVGILGGGFLAYRKANEENL